MSWVARIARVVLRVLYVTCLIVIAASPIGMIPVVFKVPRWRRKEVAAQVVVRGGKEG